MPIQPAATTLLDAFPGLSDEAVVRRVLAGETGLFEILMRRHNQRVFRVAMAVLRDETEAEDVMQEAYVRAFSRLGQFRGQASFATWLTKIALYEALARSRKRRRFHPLDPVEEGPAPIPALHDRDPEQQARNRELSAALTSAIEALPEGQRVVFVLREMEGMSTEETAHSLDISPESVRVRLHRSRAHLRRGIERALGGRLSAVYAFHLRRCDRVVAGVFERIDAEPMGERR